MNAIANALPGAAPAGLARLHMRAAAERAYRARRAGA
jgi:hypothetical protein